MTTAHEIRNLIKQTTTGSRRRRVPEEVKEQVRNSPSRQPFALVLSYFSSALRWRGYPVTPAVVGDEAIDGRVRCNVKKQKRPELHQLLTCPRSLYRSLC
jgi:hypothetical protein